MKYTLGIYNIWELGQRANQEDSMFPAMGESTPDDRLFVVCDGMGGHDSGEVASASVCEAIAKSVTRLCPDAEGKFTGEDFAQVLTEAYDTLDTKDNGASKKMGTTMTFLKFHSDGATIAHIGDSRVYHIRPGKSVADTEILFQTIDHSLVNDLIKIGELTPEEAKTSNQKNVITRAMQPNMERRPRADIKHITDIKSGDYFMLCSDGMLEQMEDDNIKYIFSDEVGTAAEKVEMLKKVTEYNKDNHTAIIVRVESVVAQPSAPVSASESPTLVKAISEVQAEKADSVKVKTNTASVNKVTYPPCQKNRADLIASIVIVIILILALGAWFVGKRYPQAANIWKNIHKSDSVTEVRK